MLRTIYDSRDNACNVGVLADLFRDGGLKVSGISQYLKQLEELGVIERRRSGKYVNYLARATNASMPVAKALELALSHSDAEVSRVFGILRNPFRARAVAYLAKGGAGDAPTMCERLNHMTKYLKRDLQPAVDGGLLTVDDSGPFVCYALAAELDPFTTDFVRLCVDHIL